MDTKKCSKCSEEMHEGFSPSVTSLSENGEIPKPVKVWKCKNGHTESYE